MILLFLSKAIIFIVLKVLFHWRHSYSSPVFSSYKENNKLVPVDTDNLRSLYPAAPFDPIY